jgi:RNA polymerase sigma-70 factor (ECF subfamily)
VEEASAGDTLVQFDDFFASAYPGIVRSVSLVVGDWEVAREVSQEAFVKTLHHWSRVSTYEHPAAWTRRVAIRMAMRTKRREDRFRTSAVPAGAPSTDSSDALWHALGQLPKMQRAATALHYLDDLPVAQVAEALGCSAATAKVHLHRARQRLATLMTEERGDVHR